MATDRGRAAGPAGRARGRAQGDAGDDPGRRRARDGPGSCSAACARWTRSSRSRTASPPAPTRRATSRRSSWSCSSPTATTSSGASSGSRSRRSPATRRCARRSSELQELLAHLEAGNTLRDYSGELPPELEPLTTKPLLAIENGPGGIDLKLEAELAELGDEEAAAVPGRAVGARGGRAAAARRARPDHVLHRRREGDARVDAAPRPDGARGGGVDPLRHRARLHPLRDDLDRTTCSRPARTPRRRGAARSGSRARPTTSRTATS